MRKRYSTKAPFWTTTARWTATIAAIVPAVLFVLSLVGFINRRDKGDAGPGNPPDVAGAIGLLVLGVELVLLIPYLSIVCGRMTGGAI